MLPLKIDPNALTTLLHSTDDIRDLGKLVNYNGGEIIVISTTNNISIKFSLLFFLKKICQKKKKKNTTQNYYKQKSKEWSDVDQCLYYFSQN